MPSGIDGYGGNQWALERKMPERITRQKQPLSWASLPLN